MNWLYLVGIIFSFIGMVVLDSRHRLAYWHDARRAVLTVLIMTSVFIVWDICGISLGIFYSGHSPYMSGIYLFPEFPLEELLFLLFLSYFSLVVYRAGVKRWQHI
jgi:lycopene cyclase domain